MTRRLRIHALFSLVFLVQGLAVPALGQDPAEPSPTQEGAAPSGAEPRVERVARLCEAWTLAKYLHPYLAYREIDWDAAFVGAAPAAWEAVDGATYRAAVEGMLAALEDPATRVIAARDPEATAEAAAAETSEDGEPPPLFRPLDDGVLLVDVAGFQDAAGPYALYAAFWRGYETEIDFEATRAMIVDLRFSEDAADDQEWTGWMMDDYLGRLAPAEARGPAERWLVHWGFRPQQGSTSGEYRSGFATSLAPVFGPSGPDSPRFPAVFLANEWTRLPDVALALQAAGAWKIVSEGPLPETRRVERLPVDLGEGLEARIRVTELVTPDGEPLAADLEVAAAAGDDDPALEAALALLSEPFPARPPVEELPASPPARWRPDRSYPEMTAPDLGHRLLAGCRLWGTIHHFYPYLHLLDDWDGAFRASLPELAAAEGGVPYARAVLRFAAHIEDSHTGVFGHPGIYELRGQIFPPIEIREIEGEIVVTRLYDLAIRGLAVGDVIHAVDGVPMAERIEATWPIVTGSYALTRRLAAARWGLAGPNGSTAVLTVSGADGVRREVEVLRGPGEEPTPRSTDDPWRLLEDTGDLRLGYVDLTRLAIPQVDPMLEALGDTDAIVFDMRGYPRGAGFPLAGRLNARGERELAQFRRREVSYVLLDEALVANHHFIQGLPQPEGEPYRGRTVMLIDDRAISQAEHTALAFEQAAGTVFIGTPTAGANGDITNLFLPGGITVSFTDHDVRHADGRQLQRVGIQPHIEAAPTLAGIRAGRDEVLERAVEYLRAELGDDE